MTTFSHLISRQKAKARGWEGPFRYNMYPGGVVHGWIVKRGNKWLHFYSVSQGRMRILLEEEKHMMVV